MTPHNSIGRSSGAFSSARNASTMHCPAAPADEVDRLGGMLQPVASGGLEQLPDSRRDELGLFGLHKVC